MAMKSSRRWFHPLTNKWLWFGLYFAILLGVTYLASPTAASKNLTIKLWLPQDSQVIEVSDAPGEIAESDFVQSAMVEKFGRGIKDVLAEKRAFDAIEYGQYVRSFGGNSHLVFWNREGEAMYATRQGDWLYICAGYISDDNTIVDIGKDVSSAVLVEASADSNTMIFDAIARRRVEIALIVCILTSIFAGCGLLFGYWRIFGAYLDSQAHEEQRALATVAKVN